MRVFLHASCGAALMLSVAAMPAAAQSPRAERPYRGLFASGTDALGQTVTVTGSASSGYDSLSDDLIRPENGEPRSRDSFLTQGSAGVNYALRGDNVTFTFGGGSSVRRYERDRTSLLQSHAVNTSVEVRPSDKTAFAVMSQVGYQPYSYASALLGLTGTSFGDTPSADLGLSATVEHYVSFSGGVEANHQVSRRSTLSGNYSYRFSNATDSRPAFSYHNFAGRYGYNIGRGLAARVGYGYGEGRYEGNPRRVPLHSLDLGVDYNRSLSFSRRTTLTFGSGSSAVTVEGNTQFGIIGSARLVREIGRSWNASLQYGRNVQVVETWQQPLFTDGVSVEFGGLMTRRLQFHSSVRGSLGHVGRDTEATRVETYSGAAGLGYAFSRSLRLSADYLYYRYELGRDAAVLPNAPGQLNQQSARVTLSVWAPVFTRTRRGDASR